MADWQDLKAELDLWAEQGKQASFWWRDDDAAQRSSALERLIALAEERDVPLAVAVIPKTAEAELSGRLREAPGVEILQHGLAHVNHAPGDEKKQEFGPHRNKKELLADIREGDRLLADFANRCAVFVPPWNRVDSKLLPVLPAFGIRGISTFGPRHEEAPVPGLERVNTHIDPVNWRGGRIFTGDDLALGQVLSHLEKRRQGLVDADEPTGLLSHHLVHDEEGWCFLARLLDLTCSHKAVKWLRASEAFGFDK
ncbi:MAG TPA: hypothetical protein ENJ57_08670 [Rhizobiales bacterium]|nr:hypothetical protein [Hyphomicrobiales bacterium]